jgi:hypothetical protein
MTCLDIHREKALNHTRHALDHFEHHGPAYLPIRIAEGGRYSRTGRSNGAKSHPFK